MIVLFTPWVVGKIWKFSIFIWANTHRRKVNRIPHHLRLEDSPGSSIARKFELLILCFVRTPYMFVFTNCNEQKSFESIANSFEYKIKWIANVWLRSHWKVKLNCSTLPNQNPHLSCNMCSQRHADVMFMVLL